MADARFLRVVERQAMAWLAVGCACYALMLGAYALGYLTEWLNRPSYSSEYLLYQLFTGLNTWASLLAIVGCGSRWPDFSNRGWSAAPRRTPRGRRSTPLSRPRPPCPALRVVHRRLRDR